MKRREAKGLDNKGKQSRTTTTGSGGGKKRQKRQTESSGKQQQQQQKKQQQVEDSDSDSTSAATTTATSENEIDKSREDSLVETYKQKQQLLNQHHPAPTSKQRLLLDVNNKTTKPKLNIDNRDNISQNSSLLFNNINNNNINNKPDLNLDQQRQHQLQHLSHQQEQIEQQIPMMSSRSSSDNNFISSKQHHFEEAKSNKMTYCFKGKWILLLSMSLTLIITAVLVAILTINLLDNEDLCFQNTPFQQASYNLFSTKTTYSTTFEYLNLQNGGSASNSGPLSSLSPSTSSINLIKSLDRNSIELPNIFSKSDSLKTLHDKLTNQGSDQTSTSTSNNNNNNNSCKVRQFHYFGRHAARFPSSKNIDEINKLVLAVQNRIDLSKFSSNLNNNANNNNNNNNFNQQQNNATSSANSTNVCNNPLTPYKQWVSFVVPKQGNLIIESGIKETDAIASRLKSIYPDLFNSSKTKIDIGTTEELRTAQTALVFLKQFDNFDLDFCSIDQFPTENISDPSKADEIGSNDCYKQFIKKFYKEKLAFHKKCESLHKTTFPLTYHLNLKDSNKTEFIANSVSKKLRLVKEDYLSPNEVDALYKICSYETALKGSSIWCNLFSDSDLKFYEYLNDVDDFFNQAYGHPDQFRSACPVTSELMKAFKTVKHQSTTNGNINSNSKPEAHFYFTHSEVIQKILAASVDLEQDPQYQPRVILEHLKAGTTPRQRQWRTSIFTPFSANLAFTLYECPIQNNNNNNNNYNNGEYTIDVDQSPFKIVASLNEQPIKLDGCLDYVCDLNELMHDSRIDKERRCRFEEICTKRIQLE